MKKLFIICIALFLNTNLFTANLEEQHLKQRAGELAQKLLIVDGHIDLPLRIYGKPEPVAEGTERGDFDYPRAVKGGLNAPFMSIYVPPRYQGTDNAKIIADSLINIVEGLAEDHPDKFAVAYNTDDIYKHFEKGIMSLPMGMENGAPVTDSEMLRYFYDRGIRYITLTHSQNNHIGDSSYDDEEKWGGLSPYGKELIKEMNNIGMMIDVSHITDKTFYDVIELTEAPVIASHSSCRHFTPGFERNMSDDMIKKLGENGGVIQINFGSYFLDSLYQKQSRQYREHINEFITVNGLERTDPKVKEFRDNYLDENPRQYADVKDVADHIDHAVKLAGIDHVGLGSDYDGVGDSLPTGLKDVSMFPNLIYELLKRGYSEQDIEKICSGNIMRVWKEVEEYARH